MSAELLTSIAAVMGAATGLVTALGVIIIAVLNKRQNEKLTVQNDKMDVQNKTLEVVHKLVNSGMEHQLRIGMLSAQTLANLTNSKSDIALADEATQKYEAHMRKTKESQTGP